MTPLQKEIEAFEKEFPNVDSAIKSYGEYCAVRDFLRQSLLHFTRSVIQEAMPEERIYREDFRCGDCGKCEACLLHDDVLCRGFNACRIQFQENVEKKLTECENQHDNT